MIHDLCQTDYYDLHRKNLMDVLGNKYRLAKLKMVLGYQKRVLSNDV